MQPAPSPQSTQLGLPITLPDDRALIPLEAAQLILDLDEDSVLGEIERGKIGWAWDIRTPAATRREIRVWRKSLLARAAGRDETVNLPDALPLAIPARGEFRLMEVARWFACSGSHVSNLIREGCLELAGERPVHSSASAVTRVTRESVVQFLGSRRLI